MEGFMDIFSPLMVIIGGIYLVIGFGLMGVLSKKSEEKSRDDNMFFRYEMEEARRREEEVHKQEIEEEQERLFKEQKDAQNKQLKD